jgi:hypothetical protein
MTSLTTLVLPLGLIVLVRTGEERLPGRHVGLTLDPKYVVPTGKTAEHQTTGKYYNLTV